MTQGRRWPVWVQFFGVVMASLAVLVLCFFLARQSLADCAAEQSKDAMCGMGSWMLRIFGYVGSVIVLFGGVGRILYVQSRD